MFFRAAGFSVFGATRQEISHERIGSRSVPPRLFGEMVSFIGDTMQQPVVPRFLKGNGDSERRL